MKFRTLSFAALAIVVGGCSGGGEGGLTNGDGTTSVDDLELRLGRGFGNSFEEGQLDIAVTDLAAGGSTTVAVTLVDADGAARSGDFSVSFSSPCQSQQLAELATPVASANGRAQTTYVARGCEGSDTITARVVENGNQVTASGVLTVAAAELGSLRFLSADPDNIALRGAGGAGRQETSTVVFQVRDSSEGAVRGQLVRFDLSTRVGGITISSSAACSSADGNVQTVVQSGDVATVVRVTAQLIDNEPRGANGACLSAANGGTVVGSTQSDELTISTGVPDFDSVSLSIGPQNPARSAALDGVESTVVMRLADRFNNPVPSGTAVQFRTEGGVITSSCTTDDTGACSVTWRSQNPRPADGVISVMAFAIGEESFSDENGNGRFDSGDVFVGDLPEAWVDSNDNFQRDAGEPFIDFDQSSDYSAPDGKQSSVLCSDDNRCLFADDGSPQLLNVFGFNKIILPREASQLLVYLRGDEPSFNTISEPCDNGNAVGQLQCNTNYTLVVCDNRNNVIGVGSTVSVTAKDATVNGAASQSFSVPSTTTPANSTLDFNLRADGDEAIGEVTVSAETVGLGSKAVTFTATDCAKP